MNCKQCNTPHAGHELINELCHRCTAKELERVSKQFGTCSVCGFCAWKDKDAKTEECQFCKLKAELERVNKALAGMRAALDRRDAAYARRENGDIANIRLVGEIEGILRNSDARKEVMRDAIASIRDSILHQRHQLEGLSVDNDVINAVLGIIDDATLEEK